MNTEALRGLFKFFDPTDLKRGLWLLIGASFIVMTALRTVVHPQPVVFQTGETGNGDYALAIWMSALLIAIDAMLVVILSWSHLRNATDALIVAAMVALTHVCFPLFTFGITVGAKRGVEALGLPFIAGGAQATIYLVAFLLIIRHLWNVHVSVRQKDVDLFEPSTRSMRAVIVQVWPTVFAVSIDALIVGPAKVAFAARYPPLMLYFSFVLVGVLVFALVCGSGFAVIGLKRMAKRHETRHTQQVVHYIDWFGSLILIGAFIYFSVFAGVYVVYTFVETEWLLTPTTIWGTTVTLFAAYLLFGKIETIKTASKQRVGLIERSA